MKTTISNISDNYLQNWTLSKEIDNTFIKESIDAKIICTNEDHKYLVEAAVSGFDKETGQITYMCADTEFAKDVFVTHSEGKFNLLKCFTEKKIFLANPLDCITNKKVNIFDYAPTKTNSLQGILVNAKYYNEVIRVYDPISGSGFIQDPTYLKLDEALALLGGIPDNSGAGFYPEFVTIDFVPLVESYTDPLGNYTQYVYHKLSIAVDYVSIISLTQITPYWRAGGFLGYYFYPDPIEINWNTESQATQEATDFNGVVLSYQLTQWTKGRQNQIRNVEISNTIPIQPILEGVFACTGLDLVSNFFNVNPDSTQPDNKYYDFSSDFCQNIKIVQSYDIIKETAIQDSFAQSGEIENIKLLKNICLAFNTVIVRDGTNIRFEHISYFFDRGIDLTTLEYEISELDLNKESIQKEVFSLANTFNNDEFFKCEIDYKTGRIYEEPFVKEYKNEMFVSDVFSSINNPDFQKDEYKKLFYLLCTDGDSIIGLNSPFSINSLVKNLHDLRRPMKSGYINDEKTLFGAYSVGFEGEIKLKSNAIVWDSLFPFMAVKTKLGVFMMSEISLKDDGLLTIKINK